MSPPSPAQTPFFAWNPYDRQTRNDTSRTHVDLWYPNLDALYAISRLKTFFKQAQTIPWCIIYIFIAVLAGGLLSALVAYLHIVLGQLFKCWGRLILVTCSYWTEDLLAEYRILERASELGEERSHEALTSLTARLHSLYWIFIPGFAILSKMGKYLNQHPTWFICGRHIQKVPSPDYFLRCDAVRIKEWQGESDHQLLDEHGKPVMGADGKPLIMNGDEEYGDDLRRLKIKWGRDAEGDQLVKLEVSESAGLQWEYVAAEDLPDSWSRDHAIKLPALKERLGRKLLEKIEKEPRNGFLHFSRRQWEGTALNYLKAASQVLVGSTTEEVVREHTVTLSDGSLFARKGKSRRVRPSDWADLESLRTSLTVAHHVELRLRINESEDSRRYILRPVGNTKWLVFNKRLLHSGNKQFDKQNAVVDLRATLLRASACLNASISGSSPLCLTRAPRASARLLTQISTDPFSIPQVTL